MNINHFIDHTLLKNTAQNKDFEKLIAEAIEYDFAAVCVPPAYVKLCKDLLQGQKPKLCSVAAFAQGYSTLATKKFEIENLYETGCDEVDVVLNINNVKNKAWNKVEKEFKTFAKYHQQNKCIKVIIESGILTQREVSYISEIALANPTTFLKTSTGFAAKSATLEAVTTMKNIVGHNILIKASGGIRTRKQADAFVKAGANRLGCSASVQIVKGF